MKTIRSSILLILFLTLCACNDTNPQVQSPHQREGTLHLGPCGQVESSSGSCEDSYTDGTHTGLYRIFVPSNYLAHSDKKFGLLVYFHGDSGDMNLFIDEPQNAKTKINRKRKRQTRANRESSESVQNLANERNLILVSMEAPVGGVCWWTPHKQQRAQYFKTFLEKVLLTQFRVDERRIILAGVSGGSFWNSPFDFFTKFSHPTSHILLCGGDVPRMDSAFDYCDTAPDSTADDPVDPTISLVVPEEARKKIRFYYAIGSLDEWLTVVKESKDFYEKLGFQVQYDEIPNAGHCSFNFYEYLLRGLNFVDQSS